MTVVRWFGFDGGVNDTFQIRPLPGCRTLPCNYEFSAADSWRDNFDLFKSIHFNEQHRSPDAGAIKATIRRMCQVLWGEDYDLCIDATYAIVERLSVSGLQLRWKLCRAMSCMRFRGADGPG